MSSIYNEIHTNWYRKKDLTQREKQAKDKNSSQAKEYYHPCMKRCSTHKKINVN